MSKASRPAASETSDRASFRTILPNPRLVPRYAGIATFCRFPRIEEVLPAQRPIDWAVYGVPFDGGVTYRPGARFGPRSVREQSQYVKPVHLEHGVNIAQTLSLADAGDAPVSPFDQKQNLDGVAEFALGLGDPVHTRLLAVGGDHSIAYANLRATWERAGKPRGGLPVLHFDAHLDTVDVIAGSQWSHGSPFRRAHEQGMIDATRMLSIGIRGPLNSLDDLEYGRTHGMRMLRVEEAMSAEGIAAIKSFVARLGDAPVYLSFDIDCVDPAFAPGTGTPCCGGFTSAQALGLLRACAGANVIGADVVEVLPDRDAQGVTALLAAHVLFEILALDAWRRTR